MNPNLKNYVKLCAVFLLLLLFQSKYLQTVVQNSPQKLPKIFLNNGFYTIACPMELAVKTTKQLSRESFSPNGDSETDKIK